MTDPKFAARAWIQGGSSGLLGDLVGNALVSPYKEHLTDMLGPTVSDRQRPVRFEARSAKLATTDPTKARPVRRRGGTVRQGHDTVCQPLVHEGR